MLEHLTYVSPQRLGEHLASFRKEAFRLECLQSFDVDGERALFTQFRNGKAPALPGPEDSWNKIIKAARLRGASMSRVRVVIPPISEYLKFEISWGYSDSVRYGEDIRVIEVRDFLEIPSSQKVLK